MAQTNRQVAQRIVSRIEDDLNDRRGLHLDTLDDDVLREIRETWQRLIVEELRTLASPDSPG